MPDWAVWLIVIGIGLVTGLIVHSLMRLAQGASVMVPLLAGLIGALAAAWWVPAYVSLAEQARPAVEQLFNRFFWAAIGGLALSALAELAFVGSTRGRVVTV